MDDIIQGLTHHQLLDCAVLCKGTTKPTTLQSNVLVQNLLK